MMNYHEMYRSKLGPPEGALDLVRSGDTIAIGAYGNEPIYFVSHLHTIAARVENVVLWSVLMMGDYPVMSDDSLKGRIDIKVDLGIHTEMITASMGMLLRAGAVTNQRRNMGSPV